MDILPEILKLGIGGIFGAVGFWLYMQERKSHDDTRKQLIDTMNARLEDSRTSVAKVTDALGGLTLGVQAISDKIKNSRGTE